MSIAQFLAMQDPELRRERLLVTRPDLVALMQRWGAAWRVLAEEALITCPEDLVVLGDAMESQFIYFEFLEHAYAMLTPENARRERRFLAESARQYGTLDRSTMLPIFGQDAALLLLAADGIHAMEHDAMEDDEIVATSISDLLRQATPKGPSR